MDFVLFRSRGFRFLHPLGGKEKSRIFNQFQTTFVIEIRNDRINPLGSFFYKNLISYREIFALFKPFPRYFHVIVYYHKISIVQTALLWLKNFRPALDDLSRIKVISFFNDIGDKSKFYASNDFLWKFKFDLNWCQSPLTFNANNFSSWYNHYGFNVAFWKTEKMSNAIEGVDCGWNIPSFNFQFKRKYISKWYIWLKHSELQSVVRNFNMWQTFCNQFTPPRKVSEQLSLPHHILRLYRFQTKW